MSEEVSGALPSLISLMVSVDVKPYVLLLNVGLHDQSRGFVVSLFVEEVHATHSPSITRTTSYSLSVA